MAEPILPPDHPLEEYFNQMLDDELNMPGYLLDLVPLPPRLRPHPFLTWATRALAPIIHLILTHLSPPTPDPLSEQLKFRIISSSLLSSNLPTNIPPSVTSPSLINTPRTTVFGAPDPPGTLKEPDREEEKLPARMEGDEDEEPTIWMWACVAAAVSALLGSWILFLMLQLACLAWSIHSVSLSSSDEKADMSTSVLETVDGLIGAAQYWDAVLSEALSLLSPEDSIIPYDPTHTPVSPTAFLRSVLRSALRDTTSRSDTVRSLLTPITDAGALRLLGEMYAPAPPRGVEPPSSAMGSPSGGSISMGRRESVISPPLMGSGSFSMSRRGGSISGTPARLNRKRMSLAVLPTSTSAPSHLLADSPHSPETSSSSRSDNTLFRTPHPLSSPPQPRSAETPPTPSFIRGHSVSRSRSDNHLRDSYIKSKRPATPVELQSAFTSASSDTPRTLPRRRSFSLITSPTPPSLSRSPSLSHKLHRPHPSSPPSTLRGPRRRTSVIHRLRNPLSLASLTSDLSTALDSRRWTSAHLLALRFDEDSSEAYWEDVRDVLRVWASALAELAQGVREAVEDAAAQVEERARAPISPLPLLSSAFPNLSRASAGPSTGAGFAPSNSPTARFLEKVDAVGTVLTDMHTQVARSTAALRQWNLSHMRDVSLDGSDSDEEDQDFPGSQPHIEDPLATYDALRSMFACALREYERGRAELVVVLGRQKQAESEEDGLEGEEEAPALVQDHGSLSGSDEHGVLASPPGRILEVLLARQAEDDSSTLEEDDDAPRVDEEELDFSRPGIEQVFEESGAVGAWHRERSTLSREERIARVRELRANPPPEMPARREGTALGPEVVRELKDVIRKVGERRLALVEKQKAVAVTAVAGGGTEGMVLANEAPVALFTPPVSPPSRVLEATGE